MVAQTMARQLVSKVQDIYLISALSHIAEETFDRIRALNIPMDGGRELVKRQEMRFILPQAAHRFWIALAVFGFEGRQLGDGLLLVRLFPDANQFGLHIPTFSPGDGVEDIALFMHQTALTRGGCKQLRDRGPQSIMPIGHDQVDLGDPSCAQILQEAEPSLFAFLRARAPRQHLFVACQIHRQGG